MANGAGDPALGFLLLEGPTGKTVESRGEEQQWRAAELSHARCTLVLLHSYILDKYRERGAGVRDKIGQGTVSVSP